MSIDYEQELDALAHTYAQLTLPITVYGSAKKTIEKWVQKIVEKSDIKTIVIDDAESRSHTEQQKLALRAHNKEVRIIFITSRSPYELAVCGSLSQELALQLSVLPVELL